MNMVALGQKLKAARLASRKWSKQEAVGSYLGVSGSAVGLYERGKRVIPADKLFLLCDLYGIDIGSFSDRPRRRARRVIDNGGRAVDRECKISTSLTA